ncbi:hypothetical protein KORDIASMS9_04003 [Kordia sp. SMS9]|uniref:DUF4252 domain-containing protein n=1 Tax=Kordia sp. SMS9 TaxID=2282170 RepID=UPI000E0DDAA9|nr:DUF4252 domain-containing protein [Kordia sp. SMS9]AXG71746.1 hypothetical protein KORDIASMS9_04003 [Kordia sp. SMS9]
MKKFIVLVMLLALPVLTFGQNIFEKYADNDNVTYVSIKPRMFKMLADMGIDADDPEAKEFLAMVNSMKSLQVLATEDKGISAELKTWVGKRSSKLEELMQVRDGDTRVKFYVKEGKSPTHVKELLMYITGLEDKIQMKDRKINTVVVSLLGDIDLTQVSKLTSQMNIPGGEHLKNVKKN